MANPYHDADGKFCSAGEMIASASDLIAAGDWHKANELKKEYEQITETRHNKGFDAAVVEQNRALQLSATSEDNPLQSIIVSDSWSDQQLEQVAALAEQKQNQTSKDIQELNRTLTENTTKVQQLLGSEYRSANEALYKSDPHEKGEQLLNQLKKAMVEEGVPSRYAEYYIERAGVQFGIKDGWDSYKNRAVGRKERKELTVKSLPKTKRPEDMEKIVSAASRVFATEDTTEYNQKVVLNRKNGPAAKKLGEQSYQVSKTIEELKTKQAQQAKVVETVNMLKQFREKTVQAGVPAKHTIMNVSGVTHKNISVDADGKINNLWGVKGDKVERIIGVKPLSYPEGAYHLVGENGGEYYNQTHYANRSRYEHTNYVVAGPSDGDPVTTPLKFDYSIDSGD